jgi:hypothetical protein
MRRSFWLLGACLLTVGALASSAWSEPAPAKEFIPVGRQDPMLNWSLPMITVQSGETLWVNVHNSASLCPGNPNRGGEATGGPGPLETWCFEGGAGDSTSTGGSRTYVWESFDRRVYRDDVDSSYWHASTWQPVAGLKSMWCGGFNDRCGSWNLTTTGGYAAYWQQNMQLELFNPLGFNLTNGCSLKFSTHYVVECDYDYAVLEYKNKSGKWYPIDAFNGRSGCTVVAKACLTDWNNYRSHDKCPTGPVHGSNVNYPSNWRGAVQAPHDFAFNYANGYVVIPGDSISASPGSVTNILFRWRMTSDQGLSTSDGNTQVKGFWVDDVEVKAAGAVIHSENFEGVVSAAYTFPQVDPIYDGWALRHDSDPPNEGFLLPEPGDDALPSACDVNASWQWSIVAEGEIIPPPDNEQLLPGYMIALRTPAIPLDYNEGSGTFSKPGVVIQRDSFQNMLESNCSYTDTWVQVHKTSGIGPYAGVGGWCETVNLDGFVLFGGGTFWNIDVNEDLSAYTSAGVAEVDSVRYWMLALDVGNPGDDCWDPAGDPPYIDDQSVVDNVSVGIIDGSATTFTSLSARSGTFQDTFHIRTCMHTPNVANADLGFNQITDKYLLHDQSESLGINVIDADGLAAGDVLLHWSYDRFATEETPVVMTLAVPDPDGNGGGYTATICDTPWVAGSEISWFLTAEDALGNVTYFPSASAPGEFPRLFNVVDVLPTEGAKILLVDDFGANRRDYHPCRQDTLTDAVEDFYELALNGLGYEHAPSASGDLPMYDKYDVGFPSSNQRINEPYGYWAAHPDSPDVGVRNYDVVIWTTGPAFNSGTIQDTTQTFLKQFVFNGGKVILMGDRIMEDLTDPLTAVDPEFVPGILGAELSSVGFPYHASAFIVPDLFPTATGVGSWLESGDSLHLYLACDIIHPQMDKITLNSTAPTWAAPQAYLTYDDVSAPFDSLGGIYNVVTFDPDSTGQVFYIPWCLSGVVDQHLVSCDPPASTPAGPGGGPGVDVGFGTFYGRAELIADMLKVFGCPVETGVAGGAIGGPSYVTMLMPPAPNPFNPETAVGFSLASKGQVSLAVFDVQGRRVRTLVNEVREAGPHVVRWDGRNDSGQSVASGMYFTRMEAEGFSATQKMTLLK